MDDHHKFIYNDRKVGSLSKKGIQMIQDRVDKGYKIEIIEVLDLMYWYDKEKDVSNIVMIPKIKFNNQN